MRRLCGAVNYDYMKVGEEKFLPVDRSRETYLFEIQVTVFDPEVAVAPNTTAMSTPHEIEYTLLLILRLSRQ